MGFVPEPFPGPEGLLSDTLVALELHVVLSRMGSQLRGQTEQPVSQTVRLRPPPSAAERRGPHPCRTRGE